MTPDAFQWGLNLASFLDDPGAMEQMRRIIDQEREHVRQLEAVRAEGAPPALDSA